MNTHRTRLTTFDLSNLPTLDVAVLAALDLFNETPPTTIDISHYSRPLVIGSGNAEVTGSIISQGVDAVCASESTFAEKLATTPAIDGVVVVSASGEKDAPVIITTCRQAGLPITLLTTTAASSATRALDGYENSTVHVFSKNREPYTYNTSTYLGMILASTGESAGDIEQFIGSAVATSIPDLSHYNRFYLITPSRFAAINRMLSIKFIELFGRQVAYAIETDQYVRHATTVVPSDELFISFGTPNTAWGSPDQRLHIPLPDNAGYGAMMAIGYYVIGQIQNSQPAYFADNINGYIEQVNRLYGSTLQPIVEVN